MMRIRGIASQIRKPETEVHRILKKAAAEAIRGKRQTQLKALPVLLLRVLVPGTVGQAGKVAGAWFPSDILCPDALPLWNGIRSTAVWKTRWHGDRSEGSAVLDNAGSSQTNPPLKE